MVINDNYLKDRGFSIYKDIQHGYEKYLWTNRVKIGHNDEYDEDIYHEELICIYKTYTYDDEHNPIFIYEISIYIINPGIYAESLEFKHKLDANKEITTEYVETLRGVFGI